MNNERKSQVSVGLTKEEKTLLLKTSFQQNRSVSQVMRFAVKKYLDLITNPMESHLESHSVEDTFSRLAIQIARNADILNAMSLEEVNSIASTKIKPNEMAVVIVGNTYLIKKKLENLVTKQDGIRFNFKLTEIKY